jgi:hypothetical protein
MVRQIEDNRSYPVDDDLFVDSEGLCVTHDDDGDDPNTVKLAEAADPFLGVTYRSQNTLYKDVAKKESYTNPQEGGPVGEPISVQQAGQVLVRCVEGEYKPGEEVELVGDGLAGHGDGSGTDVGTVVDYKNVPTDPDFDSSTVIVDITGKLGGGA